MKDKITESIKDSKPQNKSLAFSINVLCLLLIVILLGGMSFNFWQNSLLKKQYQVLQEKYQDEMQDLQQAVKNLSRSENDFVVAEVNSLINAANICLNLNKDSKTALEILQIADAKLAAQATAASFVKMRQTINQDIVALQAVKQLDIPGLILKIAAVSEKIMQLPIEPGITQIVAKQEKAAFNNASATTWWQKFSAATLQHLKNIVIVRRQIKPVEPLLPAVEQLYLKQNIKLVLGQAKWALLNNDFAFYHSSLQETMKLVNSAFAHNLAVAQGVIQSLNELNNIELPVMPQLATQEASPS